MARWRSQCPFKTRNNDAFSKSNKTAKCFSIVQGKQRLRRDKKKRDLNRVLNLFKVMHN